MYQHITLEVSLKPFKSSAPEAIRATAEQIFRHWYPLIKGRQSVAIMLWVADGSEILDYRGELDRPFEWCKFIGSANPPPSDPRSDYAVSIHAKSVLYDKNPRVMTYRELALIVKTLKEVGREMLGDEAEILVTETFDIGPEFAISEFKYKRHPELCLGMALGHRCFINSYGTLAGDSYPYAAYPDGVPDGTPFGRFFGAQCRHFLRDLGFDELWLSNGVGFSAEPWTAKGAVFDGRGFDTRALDHVKEKVLEFWHLFRLECPDIRVKTRGTNLSAGIDYATDAVPLHALYSEELGMIAPPNSPWAALDGNFGLELMGHMSRIAMLPSNRRFFFRYYIHDPWWSNSPWYDRYEGKPHDIYLPMALSRIDADGATDSATDFGILSIDNCRGEMPDSCVNEPLPHILRAEHDAPDAPAPLVWLYPLREYTTAEGECKLNHIYASDWFVSEAINAGLPLSSVVASDAFLALPASTFAESIILSPIPDAGSELEAKLLGYIAGGGRVLFFGDLTEASSALLDLLSIKLDPTPRYGEIELDPAPGIDIARDGRAPRRLTVRTLESVGGINTRMADTNPEMKEIITAEGYILAVSSGRVAWYRATASQAYRDGQVYPVPDDRMRYEKSESLLRAVLATFGLTVAFATRGRAERLPSVMLHRSDNGFFYSVYTPSTTVETRLKTPDGAPLLLGYEAEIKGGLACYRFPRAEHAECRVFVSGMDSGVVYAREMTSESQYYRRRIEVSGLSDAEVAIYPERYCIGDLKVIQNGEYPFVSGDVLDGEWDGPCLRLHHVSGKLSIHMPRTKRGSRFESSEPEID